MDLNLTPNDIAECITTLISRNKLWAGKKVYAYFIVNKTAGCFTNFHKSENTKNIFLRFRKKQSSSLNVQKKFPIVFFQLNMRAMQRILQNLWCLS